MFQPSDAVLAEFVGAKETKVRPLVVNLKRQRIHQKFLPATLIFQLPVGWKVRDVNRRRLRLLRPTTPDALCAFSVDGGGDGAWVSSSPASK